MKKFITTMALLALTAVFSQNTANATALFYTNATYPLTATGAKAEDLNCLKKGTRLNKQHSLFYRNWRRRH